MTSSKIKKMEGEMNEIIEIVDDELSSLCPVCESWITANRLQEHVDSHFMSDDASSCLQSDDADWKICHQCHNKVAYLEWADHVYAHNLENIGNVNNDDIVDSGESREDEGCCSKMMDRKGGMDDSFLAIALQEEEENEMERMKKNEEQEFQRLQSLYGMNSTSGFAKQYKKSIDKQVSKNKLSIGDYYSNKEKMLDALISGEESGESCTKCIIEKLQQRFQAPGSSNSRLTFCTPADHFSTSHGDRQWGCGYRNLQMLLSALLKITRFETVIRRVCKKVPSIPKIQHIIEDAWKTGFDKQGALQLGNKLSETRKWIGATEIAVVLRFIGLRANIVDFHRPTASSGTHAEMFAWVQRYFDENETPTPLYLQHQGHSRTIVGFEQRLTKTANQNLLLFDPSHSQRQMQDVCQSGELKLLRKSPKQLRAKQYQVVYVSGVMDDSEQEASKILTSERIP